MMNGAKAIAKKYNEVSLILRIVVGLVIGAVLALAVRLWCKTITAAARRLPLPISMHFQTP